MKTLNEQLNDSVAEVSLSPMELEVRRNPSMVLLDKVKFHEFYEHVKTEVEAFVPDLSTETSRKAIASLAYKVARTKTAIDDAGKELNSKLRDQINVVDASRREIREKFDALKDLARKPLTEWEKAEEVRANAYQSDLEMFRRMSIVLSTDTAGALADRRDVIETYTVDPPQPPESTAALLHARETAVVILTEAIRIANRQEADRAELAKLRAEREAREAADRVAAEKAEIDRLTREREEREAIRAAEKEAAAKAAEEQRQKREAEAIARAAQEAEERVKRESEEAARKEKERVEREHQSALEAQKRERLEAERLIREEQAKIDMERRKELDEARRIASEAETRERLARQKKMQDEADAATRAEAERKLAANKKHRAAIMTAAKVALMEHAGIEEDAARKVVLAISTDKIAGVSMRFA